MSNRDELALIDYLEHMLQATQRIQRYLSDIDHTAFLTNEEKQDAVVRNMEVIGEAAGNILRHFPAFAMQYPDLPLKAAYGTRNALAHGYFKIDLEVIWKTVERDLPSMEIQVQAALKALNDNRAPTCHEE